MLEPFITQSNRCGKLKDRKAIDTGSQIPGDSFQTMPIGIRLEYGPYFCPRRLVTDNRAVVAQRSKIDTGLGRTRHVEQNRKKIT